MFVQVLKPLFTIPPAGLAIPVGELVLLTTLVLAGVGLSTLASGASCDLSIQRSCSARSSATGY